MELILSNVCGFLLSNVCETILVKRKVFEYNAMTARLHLAILFGIEKNLVQVN